MHNSWKIKTKKDDPGISRGQNKTLQLLRWIMLGCVSPHIIEEYLTYSTVQKNNKKDSPGLLPRLRSFYSFEHLQFVYTPLQQESHRSEAIDEILQRLLYSLFLKLSLCGCVGCSVFAYCYYA